MHLRFLFHAAVATIITSPVYCTSTTLVSAPISKRPTPSQGPPTPASTKSCYQGLLSNVQFNRDAAASQISNLCNDLHKQKIVLTHDNPNIPTTNPFDKDLKATGPSIADQGKVLHVHPEWMRDACDNNNNFVEVNFGTMTVEECTAPLMEALDDCEFGCPWAIALGALARVNANHVCNWVPIFRIQLRPRFGNGVVW